MNIEKLKDKAAIFLEEMNISGDAMIDMDHCIDELPEEKQGANYLHDLMALFANQQQEVVPHDTVVNSSEKENWEDLSDKFREVAHQYKDGKFDYRTIWRWFQNQRAYYLLQKKKEN